MTDDHDLERSLRAHFAEHDFVSDLSVDLAKAAFDVVRADQSLAELVEDASVPVRGDGDDVLRFVGPSVRVTVRPSDDELDELDIIVTPPECSAAIVAEDREHPIDLDSTGGASVQARGVVWLRVTAPDGTASVTPPFLARP